MGCVYSDLHNVVAQFLLLVRAHATCCCVQDLIEARLAALAGRRREPDLMMQLLSTVPRFEAVTFSSQRRLSGEISRGLAELEVCARQLLQELSLESYAPGLDVVVQGRLKSLYR